MHIWLFGCTASQRITIRRIREKRYIGSTRPSPSVPNPEPSFQPIIFSSLLPTLFSSLPGAGGAGGGEGGGGGPSVYRFFFEAALIFSGNGMSGWLCIIRRSEARSRYLGCSASTALKAEVFRAPSAFWRATSRKFVSLKFFCCVGKAMQEAK